MSELPRARGALIRPATRADLAQVTGVLTAAFDDDPVINWIVKSGDGRIANLRRYFAAQFLFRHQPVGGAYVTDDGSGAALWDLPARSLGGERGCSSSWPKCATSDGHGYTV